MSEVPSCEAWFNAPTDLPPNECEGAILMERGENKYEPICYRRSD